MPAHRSIFKQHVLPAVVVTAFLVTGLEAAAAPYADEGLRDCGRSYDPCWLTGLVAEAEMPGAAPAGAGAVFAAQDASAASERDTAGMLQEA